MKKRLMALSICLLFVLGGAVCVQAEEVQVVEAPNVNIVVDGVGVQLENTPVISAGRTFLPLRELAGCLGIENESIQWNDAEKSIILSQGDVKLQMTVGSAEATVGGETVELDAAPMLYQDKTYIPVRFVAQAFDKAVVWDSVTSTVLLRDKAGFEQVKEIMQKTTEATAAAKRYKMSGQLDMDLSADKQIEGMDVTDMKILIDALVDTDAMEFAINEKIKGTANGQAMDMEIPIYLIDNAMYMKMPEQENWVKAPYDLEKYKALAEDQYTFVKLTDTMYAGLVIEEGAPEGKLVLSGNVYVGGLLDQLTSQLAIGNTQMTIRFDQYYLKMVIDAETMLPESQEIGMSLSYDMNIPGMTESTEFTLKIDGTLNFSDYGGDFDIALPEEAANATEMPAANQQPTADEQPAAE